MIEVIDVERCTACNICVHACPTNVFSVVPDSIPVIARQEDCQTCFMCELYCPEDALYVAPDVATSREVDVALLKAGSLLGSYRKAVGWNKEGQQLRGVDTSYKLLGRATP